MRKTKKAIASLAIAGMVLSMAPMSVFGATTDSNRLAGAGRVETAIAVANQGWANGADSVIVVPADDKNVVDALAAAPLAGQLNAPILVTYKGALDPQVAKKITELGAKNVYAVGALEDATIASLKAISGVTVEQIQGADRTETAAKVAAKLTKVNGSFVVAYEGSADALSAASYAAANGYSIVISNPDGTIPASETVTAPVYTVGGQAKYTGATPLAGADRYATNDAVNNGLTFQYDKVYVANGESLVDALAGAPLAAQTKSPIVLADASKAATGVNDNLTSTSKVIALGGVGAVSDSVLGQVAYQAPATLAVESVSAINADQIKVVFNKPVDETTANNDLNYIVANNNGSALAFTTTGTKAELQDDETTVILTMDSALVLKDKTADITVTVKDAIQEKDNSAQVNGLFTKVLTIEDNTAPAFDGGVTSKTNSETAASLSFNFSEPVKSVTVKVDGSAKSYTLSENNTKVTVSGLSLDAAKSHTLQVVNAADYAGNVLAVASQDFSVTKDTAAPVISSVTPYSDNSVVVTFNKKMDKLTLDGQSNITFYGEDLSPIATKATVVYPDDDTVTKFIVQANTSIYANKTSRTLTLKFADKAIKDSLGNELAGTTQQVALTQDTVAPQVAGTQITKDSTGKVTGLVVEFNEAVQPGTYAASGITVVNKNGVDVTNDINADGTTGDAFFKVNSETVNLGDKKVTFKLAVATELTDNYSFTFAKGLVTDASEDLNKSEAVVKTVNMGTAKASSFELAAGTAKISGNKITVNYGTTVKGGDVAGSATNYANYSLGSSDLSDAIITLDYTKKIVTIDITNVDVPKSDTAAIFSITNVQNTDGDTIVPYTETLSVADNVAPVLQSARLIDNKTIELTYDENIGTLSGATVGDEFVIEQSGTELTLAEGELLANNVSGYDKKIILTVNKGTNSAGTAEVNTLTVANAATGTGNIDVTFNDGTINKTVTVAVTTGDTADVVAGKIQAAMAADTTINAAYNVTVSTADVVFTAKAAAADKTVNVTVADTDLTGVGTLSAVETTAGAAPTTATVLDTNKTITVKTKTPVTANVKDTTGNAQKDDVSAITVVKP